MYLSLEIMILVSFRDLSSFQINWIDNLLLIFTIMPNGTFIEMKKFN